MKVTLHVVSTTGWSVLQRHVIDIKHVDLPVFEEILESIHCLYPTLQEDHYELFWPYSRKDYLHIYNNKMYATTLKLMVVPIVIMLLLDAEDHHDCVDGYRIIRMFDYLDERENAKKLLLSYYLRIPERDNTSETNIAAFRQQLDNTTICCNKKNIFEYAIKDLTQIKCYTMDKFFECNNRLIAARGIYLFILKLC